jgi:hypothetical protein
MTLTPTKLVDHDCAFVAVLDVLDTRHSDINTTATRRFVAYATRPDFHITIHEETAGGLSAPLATLPGPKQGSVSLLAGIDKIEAYYTGRAEGDLSGPFVAWRIAIPVTGVYPLAFAGVLRVRAVARIVSKYLPIAAGDLLPFTK